MSNKDLVEDFLLAWNLRFKNDRKFRKKYNIPFGSIQHLESNQIDQYFDLMEDKMFEELEKKYIESVKHREEYKKTGKFLKEQIITEAQEDSILSSLKDSFKKMNSKNE